MNNTRRKQIAEIVAALDGLDLDSILGDAEVVRDEEQEYLDYMPESIKNGDKGSMAEEAVSALDSAVSNIEDAIAYLRDAIDALNEATN